MMIEGAVDSKSNYKMYLIYPNQLTNSYNCHLYIGMVN